MNPLRLFTAFWGDKHLDLFEKALVRSLSWPLNRQALQGAHWDIWTKESEFDCVLEVAGRVGIDVEVNSADQYIADLGSKYMGDSGVMMLQMFLKSMRRCIDTGSQMLIAPPDTIFGGDSIANILQAGEQKDSVVFVVHMRVLPELINDLSTQVNRFGPSSSVSNARLVTIAMRNAHRSWTEAEFGHERINSHIGGIFWKKRPSGTYAVQHMLPTPYLINWTEDDYRFFSRQNPPGTWPPVFGEIDHLWPTYCVYPSARVDEQNKFLGYSEERARLLGSSDDAFIVEITDAESNVPALENYDKENPDTFWRGALHNKINKQFIVTFRGED